MFYLRKSLVNAHIWFRYYIWQFMYSVMDDFIYEEEWSSFMSIN